MNDKINKEEEIKVGTESAETFIEPVIEPNKNEVNLELCYKYIKYRRIVLKYAMLNELMKVYQEQIKKVIDERPDHEDVPRYKRAYDTIEYWKIYIENKIDDIILLYNDRNNEIKEMYEKMLENVSEDQKEKINNMTKSVEDQIKKESLEEIKAWIFYALNSEDSDFIIK